MAPVHRKREIIGITISFVLLLCVMMGYFTHYALTHQEELLDNSFNTRKKIFEEQTVRGKILDRNEKVLAETTTDRAGKETRVYPYSELFCHEIGYTAKGKTGVEKDMNYYLIQSSLPLSKKMTYDTSGKKYPADNVVTTFDVGMQQAAAKALGAYQGAVIAMNPKTGEILAMVSKPDYDPNQIASLWDGIINDTESAVLLNRVTQGLYPAGSTLKIVTTLEYMRENPDTYSDYSFQCTGRLTRGSDTIRCYHGSKHGTVDLLKSFSKSCNSSYANIGLLLDRESWNHTLNTLLFNQKLPVTFAHNQSSLLVKATDDDGEIMQDAIGQGKTQITPLHLAMLTCAVANDGVLMVPYMVDQVRDVDGAVVKKYEPKEYGSVMTASEAMTLQSYMKDVVEHGTGTKLSGLGYSAAGKTGSAEYNSVKGESHAWFTGFAPVENPEIVVTVIIEGAGSGGDYAVPMAKRVFDAYFGESKE